MNNDIEQPDREDETDTAGEKQTEQIVETGSITGTKGKHAIHCLTIIGQVEGHFILPAQNKTTKYEHVIPQLVAIEQDPDIEGLIIILNTVGGDVEAGLAIAELIAGMNKPTVSLVLGGGHSIGVPLACSASYSLIAPSATMTIHPVRMSGLVLGVPQTLSYFDKMQERIVRFVTQNSSITAERFRELMMNKDELVMDVGTVLDGEAAVREGLIDELGGLARCVEKLYELIEAREKERAEAEPVEEREAAAAQKVAGAKRGPKPGSTRGKKPDEEQKRRGRVPKQARRKEELAKDTAQSAMTPMPAPPPQNAIAAKGTLAQSVLPASGMPQKETAAEEKPPARRGRPPKPKLGGGC